MGEWSGGTAPVAHSRHVWLCSGPWGLLVSRPFEAEQARGPGVVTLDARGDPAGGRHRLAVGADGAINPAISCASRLGAELHHDEQLAAAVGLGAPVRLPCEGVERAPAAERA